MTSLVPMVTRSGEVRDRLREDVATLCAQAGVEPLPTPLVGNDTRAQVLALREQVADLAAALRTLLAERESLNTKPKGAK